MHDPEGSHYINNDEGSHYINNDEGWHYINSDEGWHYINSDEGWHYRNSDEGGTTGMLYGRNRRVGACPRPNYGGDEPGHYILLLPTK